MSPQNEYSQEKLPNWRINLLFAGLMVGQYLSQIGVFDDTPRIYGTLPDDELLILPHYKFRTMSEEMVREVEQRKNEGTFVKGVHDKRTKIGNFLNKTNLDEIPFYQLIGVDKWFGDVRSLLIREQDNPELKEAATENEMEVIDVFRNMNGKTGYFCTQHYLGTRVLEGVEAWRQYIKAETISDKERPSKFERIYAVLHRDIRKQKKSPHIQEVQETPIRDQAGLGNLAKSQSLEATDDYILA